MCPGPPGRNYHLRPGHAFRPARRPAPGHLARRGPSQDRGARDPPDPEHDRPCRVPLPGRDQSSHFSEGAACRRVRVGERNKFE